MVRAEDKTILIVEDEPDVRLFLSTVLEDAGFNIMTASDGVEAMEKIHEKKPDFISLDLILPRKSGHKLLMELKKDKNTAQIPVLILTAHGKDDLGKDKMDEIRRDPVLLGPGMYLEKPVTPQKYLKCIQQTLGIEPTEDAEERVNLKNELRQMLDGAGSDALKKALDMLKNK